MAHLDQRVKVNGYKLSLRRWLAHIDTCAALRIRILNGRKILNHRTELALKLKAMSLMDEGPHCIALRDPVIRVVGVVDVPYMDDISHR